MKLLMGNPSPTVESRTSFYYKALRENIKTMVRDGTSIELFWPKKGYSDSTRAWTEAYNSLESVKGYYEAWKAGYDGIVIACVLDPGLIQARSIIDIPVAGACESAALFASMLGNKYSVIAHDRIVGAAMDDCIKRSGLAEKLASIRYAPLGFGEAAALYQDPPKLVRVFRESAVRVIEEDGAEAIIPGCTVLSTMLTSQGVYEIDGVPLVDPVWAALKMAEVLVDLKKAYGMGVCRSTIYSAAANWEKEIPI